MAPTPRQGSRTGLVLAVMGALMQFGPLIALAGTVRGMIQAFQSMGSSGIGDPSGLAKCIGEVLISVIAGALVSFVGIALMVIGLVVYQCRQRWLVRLLVGVGVFWLMVVPAVVFVANLKSTPKSEPAAQMRP